MCANILILFSFLIIGNITAQKPRIKFDRISIEKALRESETKFKDITEKSLVGVYLIQEGTLKYINPKFAEMFGYSVDEITDKIGPRELTYHEDWHIAEENIRKRVRPWVVRAKNMQTATYGELDKSVYLFLEQADKLAPINTNK